jgi:hypothetical protein
MWSVETTLPHLIFPIDDPLPSDCRFREDLVALSEKDIPGARESKLTLEERQRYDAKLRQNSPKPKPAKAGKEKGPVYKDIALSTSSKSPEKEKEKEKEKTKAELKAEKVTAKEKKTKK